MGILRLVLSSLWAFCSPFFLGQVCAVPYGSIGGCNISAANAFW